MFDKQIASFVLIEPEAFILDPGKTATNTQNESPIGDMVEHRDLLGNANGIMPRQYDHHRTELDVFGSSRHVGQELHRVGAHGVIVEVMLNGPDRVEPERFGHLRQANLVQPDLAVGQLIIGILKNRTVSYVHNFLLSMLVSAASPAVIHFGLVSTTNGLLLTRRNLRCQTRSI